MKTPSALGRYLKKFFDTSKAAKEEPIEEHHLIDGKAFAIKHYPLANPCLAASGDTIRAAVRENGEVIKEVEEPITQALSINTISLFRFNDALGYKHAIGAIFGER